MKYLIVALAFVSVVLFTRNGCSMQVRNVQASNIPNTSDILVEVIVNDVRGNLLIDKTCAIGEFCSFPFDKLVKQDLSHVAVNFVHRMPLKFSFQQGDVPCRHRPMTFGAPWITGYLAHDNLIHMGKNGWEDSKKLYCYAYDEPGTPEDRPGD